MKNVNEQAQIVEVLRVADKKVELSGYQGVVVETVMGDPVLPKENHFQGTLMYFPGVHVKQLGV
jgi:hypothetical protein